MALRTHTQVSLQVGLDSATDDLVFDRDICELLDTLDHAAAHVLLLEAGTTNYSVPFGDVAQGRLIYIEGDGEFQVAFGGIAATAAQVDAAGGSYPTGFAGGETLTLAVDNIATPVTFLVGDQSITAVINRINAAVALAGLATPVASNNGGQLRLTSPTTGSLSEIDVQGGTSLVTLGFAVTDVFGGNATPGTSNVSVHRPADPSGASAAAGVKSFFLGTIKTTMIQLTNPSADVDLNMKVLIAGDLVLEV
jgi:hypothetical protein